MSSSGDDEVHLDLGNYGVFSLDVSSENEFVHYKLSCVNWYDDSNVLCGKYIFLGFNYSESIIDTKEKKWN